MGERFPVKHWTEGVEFEPKAQEQAKRLGSLKFIFKHIALMPDVHWGRGCTIGTVLATKDAIIPSVVGVDLGCGMSAIRTTLTADCLPDNLAPLREAIERAVPVGQPLPGNKVAGSWNLDAIPEDVVQSWVGSEVTRDPQPASLAARYMALNFRGELEVNRSKAPIQQLGTLGGGNHFIEVCLDEQGRVWIMLHSGSRNLGKRIADVFIERAAKAVERYFIALPDRELGFIPRGTPDFDAYMDGLRLAQDYAATNRAVMMHRIIDAVKQELVLPQHRGHSIIATGDDAVVSCHHNYVSMENHFGANIMVTRKGAISAREGELGIIPTSMGRASYIVEGKGNRESFCSAPHGSGRRLGRKEAERQISLDQFASEVQGVETRIEREFIQEAPSAYKDGAAVIKAAEDLVSVRYVLKQVLCVKGK